MSGRHGTLEAMDVERDPHAPTPPPGQDQLPSEDGEPMDTPRHRDQMNLLIASLHEAWSERDDYYVGGNMFVYFSELQTKGAFFRGPDFFVVLDTERRRYRKSWVAWEEGGRLPDVVIELLSESTAHVDRGEKRRVYERVWKTGHYFLYDPHEGSFEGYVLHGGRYQPITPDARGDLPIESMGLALGIRPGDYHDEHGTWLRFVDAAGVPIPWPHERAEAATRRADEETRRADEESRRADDEKRRADAAAARVAELEAALAAARLRGA